MEIGSLTTSPKLTIQNHLAESFSDDISRDVFNGLTADQKFIPSKYFYDKRGSELFEEICTLPEYYLTRTEMSILNRVSSSIMEPFEFGDLVELGSGGNWKICRLLEDAKGIKQRRVRYVPVDVSEKALKTASAELIDLYPELIVLGVVADFTKDLDVLPNDAPQLILFFGSTIGNFSEHDSITFLKNIVSYMKPLDRLILGLDMLKPKQTLETAYNDSKGITSEFNKNILNVVNRELNANFDTSIFEHIAFLNEDEPQIEMHLKARENFKVEIRDLDNEIDFIVGETIHTEISRKYTEESASRMFEAAGFNITRWFSDQQGWFSLAELMKTT